MADVLSLQRASKPEFTVRQIDFAKELIGMGLSRLAIASLVLDTDMGSLNHADIAASARLVQKCYKELGFNITDARNVRSPYMVAAVKQAAKGLRMRVRIA